MVLTMVSRWAAERYLLPQNVVVVFIALFHGLESFDFVLFLYYYVSETCFLLITKLRVRKVHRQLQVLPIDLDSILGRRVWSSTRFPRTSPFQNPTTYPSMCKDQFHDKLSMHPLSGRRFL